MSQTLKEKTFIIAVDVLPFSGAAARVLQLRDV